MDGPGGHIATLNGVIVSLRELVARQDLRELAPDDDRRASSISRPHGLETLGFPTPITAEAATRGSVI